MWPIPSSNVTPWKPRDLIGPAAGPDFRPDASNEHGSAEAEESTRQTLLVYDGTITPVNRARLETNVKKSTNFDASRAGYPEYQWVYIFGRDTQPGGQRASNAWRRDGVPQPLASFCSRPRSRFLRRDLLAPQKNWLIGYKPTSQISGLEEKSAAIKIPFDVYEVSLVCGTS